MKKPIWAALGAFAAFSGAELVISYRRDGEFDVVFALIMGITTALAMYVYAQWIEQKENSSGKSGNE